MADQNVMEGKWVKGEQCPLEKRARGSLMR